MITILGWLGNREESLTGEQLLALGQAQTIFARPQLRDTLQRLSPSSTIIDFTSPFRTTIDAIGAHQEDCTVITSGDPNFFGITKTLLRAHPDRSLHILPAPSSVAILAARLGRPWDDLSVISLVGRDSDTAFFRARLRLADRQAGAVALLIPPNTSITRLVERFGNLHKEVKIVVATDLATAEESVISLTLDEAIHWRSSSPAVVLVEVGTTPVSPTIEFNRHSASLFRDDQLVTDGTNFTKLEVRMSAVARLNPDQLPLGARVIEVGAGSGMIGLTLLYLRPDIELTQLEPRHERAIMARANAETLGYRTTVSEQPVENILTNFDAAIVGGGGLSALTHTLDLIGPSAPVVATYADLSRAASAARLLGNLSLIQVAHGRSLGPDGVRLVPQTPIYLAWR